MARSTSRPGDLTGRVRDAQQAEYAEELNARAEELGLMTIQKQEALLNEVTDLTQKLAPVLPANEVEEIEVDSAEAKRIIVTVEDLDKVTIGAGNMWSFIAGKKYLVPEFVASHLESKGYLR